MEANIFVIGVPSLKGILSKVADAIEDEFFVKKLHVSEDDGEDVVDEDEEEECEPAPTRRPRPEDLTFGYGLEVDEPKKRNYSSRAKFIRDHKAYDDFVEAGLRCEELGLDKRNNIPVTKCKAIRKCVGDLPPTGIDLLGETEWWWEDFSW